MLAHSKSRNLERSIAVGLTLSVCATSATALPQPEPQLAERISPKDNYIQRFTPDRLHRAQSGNHLILVETYADWCAPCQIQAPIVAKLRGERRFRGLVVLRLDANSPRRDWKRLNLAGFGQFIAYQGKRELGRGSPLDEEEMRALLSP